MHAGRRRPARTHSLALRVERRPNSDSIADVAGTDTLSYDRKTVSAVCPTTAGADLRHLQSNRTSKPLVLLLPPVAAIAHLLLVGVIPLTLAAVGWEHSGQKPRMGTRKR
jgi:hypothetical protein